MFVTRKHLPRRTVLRGLGAALGLPLLDAANPAGPPRHPRKPREEHKPMTPVFSNIDSQAPIGPVHALSPGTWLSCQRPAISQEAHGGTTIDQLAAQQIGQDTPLPSREVATDVRGGGGFCDRDYGCSYAGTISFRTPTTPRAGR